MMMVAALATDSMLPSFPDIKNFFDIKETAVQGVLTVFMLGYAIPHLWIGSFADRFGRKPILLIGLGVYLVGGIISLLAPSFMMLLVGRFVQGMGAAAAPILARAILRDLFSGIELGRYMSFAMVFFAAGPMLAPAIGAGISHFFGWRAIFVFLCLVGIGLAIWVTISLEETLAEKDTQALKISNILVNAKALFQNAQSRRAMAILCLSYGSLISFLGSSPLIYIEHFKVSEAQFALIFATISCTTFFTQLINASLLKRFPMTSILGVALIANVIATTILFLQCITGTATIISTTITFAIFFATFSFALTNGTALAIDPHKSRAGVASGLIGFFNLIFGVIIATVIGQFMVANPTPLASGLLVIAVANIVIFFLTKKSS